MSKNTGFTNINEISDTETLPENTNFPKRQVSIQESATILGRNTSILGRNTSILKNSKFESRRKSSVKYRYASRNSMMYEPVYHSLSRDSSEISSKDASSVPRASTLASLVDRTSMMKDQGLLPSEIDLKRLTKAGEKCVVKFRQHLFNLRQTCISRSSLLNLLGILMTFVIAEVEIQNGLDIFKEYFWFCCF